MSLLQKLAYFLTIKPRQYLLRMHLPSSDIRPAGSRYVCSPPHFGTDVDFLVYTEESIAFRLGEMGYKETPWRDYFGQEDGNFRSWRRGRTNLIVTSNRWYAETFDTGTYLAKKHNLRKKGQRVCVHEVLRGSYSAEDVTLDEQSYGNITGIIEPHLQELVDLLHKFVGPHRVTIIKAFRAKHGLEPFP